MSYIEPRNPYDLYDGENIPFCPAPVYEDEEEDEEDDTREYLRWVIYCGDCRFYDTEECRWGHDELPNDDDYCSYAKPKNND